VFCFVGHGGVMMMFPVGAGAKAIGAAARNNETNSNVVSIILFILFAAYGGKTLLIFV
jgi:hypothetical protein